MTNQKMFKRTRNQECFVTVNLLIFTMTADNIDTSNVKGSSNFEKSIYDNPYDSLESSETNKSNVLRKANDSFIRDAKLEHESHTGFTPGGDFSSATETKKPSTSLIQEPKKFKTVKVGKRIFEVEKEDDDVFIKDASNKNYEWPVAQNVYRRKMRKTPKPPASVISLPMSSVTAFSGFTAASSSSTIKPRRSKCQLIMNSIIMLGREFCYAIEAGLTTPILLSIGLPLNLYSLVWVISPILGFVLQPIIGTLSDRCKSSWGRRRPFILALAVIVLVGMTLFLNGEQLVNLFGEGSSISSSTMVLLAILVTVFGVVLFDFSADFIEGPIRAYAMDVCDEDDVKVALYYQALFTGIGGAFGYASGGIAWTRDTLLGRYFPSDRQVVYVFASFVFIICVLFNLFSIAEKNRARKRKHKDNVENGERKRLLDNSNDNDEKWESKYDGNNNNNNNDSDEDVYIKKKGKYAITTKNVESFNSKKIKRKRNKRKTKTLKVEEEEIFYGTFTVQKGVPYFVKDGVATPIGNTPQKPYPVQSYPIDVTHNSNGKMQPVDSMIYPQIRTLQWVEEDAYRKNIIGSIEQFGYQNKNEKVIPESDSDVSSISSSSDISRSLHRKGRKNGYQNHAYLDNYQNKSDQYQRLPISHDRNPRNHAVVQNLNEDAIHSSFTDTSSKIEKNKTNKKKPSKPQEFGMKELAKSIVSMPKELKCLCVSHLLGWMAFLCVVLFFTDYVGQEVYRGDPRAPPGSEESENYSKGVEMGNLGMTINAASSSLYCFMLKPFIRLAGPRIAYMFGYFAFCVGAAAMTLVQTPNIILGLSPLIGVMSATLYTMPYFLVAQYHDGYKELKGTAHERGAGIDCALVTCMIQLAQIIVGLGIGALVVAVGNVSVTLISGAAVAFLGTIWVGIFVQY